MSNLTMDKLVNLCKTYGFIYQGSEIYGGLANMFAVFGVGAGLLGIGTFTQINGILSLRFF